MKIRAARSIDAPAIAELVAARVPDTCYAGRDEVDVPYARKIFAYAAQRHGGTNDGAMFLMVAEDDAGEIAGFVMGTLGRVYGVGKKLCATDNYLLGRKDCPARVLRNLFELYVGWASGNRRVVEVGASFSDALPGSEGWAPVFKRMGFDPCAQSFRRINMVQDKVDAA
jgi:hypothetical protein